MDNEVYKTLQKFIPEITAKKEIALETGTQDLGKVRGQSELTIRKHL